MVRQKHTGKWVLLEGERLVSLGKKKLVIRKILSDLYTQNKNKFYFYLSVESGKTLKYFFGGGKNY